VAQRGRGREAGLAGVDAAPVFGGEATQVEQLDLDVRLGGEHLAGDLDQPIGLRHFARAGVLAARRAVDQQDGRLAAVLVAPLRRLDRRPRRQPIDRQLVVRIGKLAAGLLRARSLATVVVGLPGRVGDLVELHRERGERGVLKLIQETLAEFALAQLRARHSLAR